jgi:hypothetical protein
MSAKVMLLLFAGPRCRASCNMLLSLRATLPRREGGGYRF